jgi:hypothetical protein
MKILQQENAVCFVACMHAASVNVLVFAQDKRDVQRQEHKQQGREVRQLDCANFKNNPSADKDST